MTPTTVVTEIWRYPVKSMGGHRVSSAAVGPCGLHADRLWDVRELERSDRGSARGLAGRIKRGVVRASTQAAFRPSD